jgi:SprT-like family protein
MFRALKSRWTKLAIQFELSFDTTRAPDAPRRDEPGALLLETLRRLGLRNTVACRLTRNRRVMVSHRGGILRVHESFATAPDEVLRAIATFVNRRGAARRDARRVILLYPIEPAEAETGGRRRRPGTHADDMLLAERLTRAHEGLNHEHFGGGLRPLQVRVSRAMRSRLGHYLPAKVTGTGEIVISRRHIRRNGWKAAVETLLHEMVHQWQDEMGLSVDHGGEFRRKAREVGIAPSARRAAIDAR